jgi:hypothetical protein
MADEWNPETSVSNELLDRLPPEVLETFTPEQRAALWGAAKPSSWRHHPIDIRISLPFFGFRLFMTVISGLERRSFNRRRRDSRTHPFFTLSNVIFLAVMFIGAVALGSVLTDLLHWLTEVFDLTVPAATGVLAPK